MALDDESGTNRCELDTATGAVGGSDRRSDPQAAVLRPGVLRAGDRDVLAAGVADGVPARGDPQARRLRGVRDPRRVDHRGAGRQRQRAGLPQRLPPSRRKAGGRQRKSAHLRLPVPRLVLGHRRTQHVRAATRGVRRATTCARTTCNSSRSGASSGADARGSTSTTTLPPLRDCIEPFASIYDAWKVESLRVEWWQSCRLPVNWKLATAAFMEGYHVPQTHPQLLPSAQTGSPSEAVHPVVAEQPVLHAHAGRRHGRHDPRERHPHRRGPAEHRAARRSGRGDGRLAQRPQRRGRQLASGPGQRHARPQRPGPPRDHRRDRISASRTTSSCPPTAAPRRTGSARSGPRKPCSRSGPSPASPRTCPPESPHRRSRWRPTTRAGRRSPPRTSPTCRDSKKACIPRALSTCGCRTRSRG